MKIISFLFAVAMLLLFPFVAQAQSRSDDLFVNTMLLNRAIYERNCDAARRILSLSYMDVRSQKYSNTKEAFPTGPSIFLAMDEPDYTKWGHRVPQFIHDPRIEAAEVCIVALTASKGLSFVEQLSRGENAGTQSFAERRIPDFMKYSVCSPFKSVVEGRSHKRVYVPDLCRTAPDISRNHKPFSLKSIEKIAELTDDKAELGRIFDEACRIHLMRFSRDRIINQDYEEHLYDLGEARALMRHGVKISPECQIF